MTSKSSEAAMLLILVIAVLCFVNAGIFAAGAGGAGTRKSISLQANVSGLKSDTLPTVNSPPAATAAEAGSNTIDVYTSNAMTSGFGGSLFDPVARGENQTFAPYFEGRVTPHNSNTFAYNSLTNSIYPFMPDVLVIHANGQMVGYDSSADTDQGRGAALGAAESYLVTGDSIYLKAETYNVVPEGGFSMAGGRGVATNTRLYGAGVNKTIIRGYQSLPFNPGINSIVADLSFYGMNYQELRGYTGYGNDTVRNTHWQGYIDGIYLMATPAYGNVVFYNSTLTSGWDTICLGAQGDMNGNLILIDSRLNPVLNNTGGQDPQLWVRGAGVYSGNLILVNTTITIADDGTTYAMFSDGQGDAGVDNYQGTVSIYGGSISSAGVTHGTVYDLYSYQASAKINVNSTVAYGTHSGTVGPLGAGGYGNYTYPKGPVPPHP